MEGTYIHIFHVTDSALQPLLMNSHHSYKTSYNQDKCFQHLKLMLLSLPALYHEGMQLFLPDNYYHQYSPYRQALHIQAYYKFLQDCALNVSQAVQVHFFLVP